jgi:hypothetical protein
MHQKPILVSSLVPVPIATETLLAAMLLIISTITFVYIFLYNYTQDWQMKTKHKQSVSKRIKNVTNRKSELEKIKHEGGNDDD